MSNGEGTPPTPEITYCDLFSTSKKNHNLATLDATNLTLEPGFLIMGDDAPEGLHLALSSALIGKGDPLEIDADGSRTDMDCYGGASGDQWDLDDDGFPDWFWPGTLDDAPEGFDPKDYDCDDSDGSRLQGGG